MSAISVVMGSKSDWPTVKEGCKILDQFGVDYEKNVISAHRMPNEMFAFAQKAVEIAPDDTPETLQRRVMEQAEWVLLPQAAEQVCAQLQTL